MSKNRDNGGLVGDRQATLWTNRIYGHYTGRKTKRLRWHATALSGRWLQLRQAEKESAPASMALWAKQQMWWEWNRLAWLSKAWTIDRWVIIHARIESTTFVAVDTWQHHLAMWLFFFSFFKKREKEKVQPDYCYFWRTVNDWRELHDMEFMQVARYQSSLEGIFGIDYIITFDPQEPAPELWKKSLSRMNL